MIIKLTQGKETIVDDNDYEALSLHKWQTSNGYATRCVWDKIARKNRTIYMHRIILSVPIGLEADHINGDKLNNKRSNLRICAPRDNKRNQRIRSDNTSGYKGVCWDKANDKWMSSITVEGKSVNLGRFKKRDDAARAYNQAAIKNFGEFANLNIIS